MPTSRWEQVKELFASVVECDPEERLRILGPVRERDPELCSEVEALLEQSTETLPLGQNLFENLDLLEVRSALLLDQRYRLEHELGRGAFGVVYLARDERLNRKPVVVKFLSGKKPRDEWFRKKFRDEIKALSLINHPGIVEILDAGQTPAGTPFIVMQHIEGVTLRSFLGPGGLPLNRTGQIVQQIGQALAAAHSRGVCHRDLKPENIMVQQLLGGEFVRLIDFGIAIIREKGFESDAEPTRVAGSLAYMAPEQFRGQPMPASDTFALGVIAWEMLAGKLPFGDICPMAAVADRALVSKLEEIRQLRPEVPVGAVVAIRKALSIEPADRFESASAFGDELARTLSVPVVQRALQERSPTLQERLLDLAIARQIPVLKPAELIALIRRTESGGLAAVLQMEPDHALTNEDIRSKPFQLEFPVDAAGEIKPLELGLRIDCPDFEPKAAVKTILLPPSGDSEACSFLITPLYVGELRVNVELTRSDVLVTSRALKTEATPSDRSPIDSSNILVSIPLSVIVRAPGLILASAPGEFTRMFQAPAPPPAPPPAPAQPGPASTQPGEFTRMFQAPARAAPQPAPIVPRGPSEYTQIFSQPAGLTLGQPSAQPQSQAQPKPPAPASRAKSNLPLILGLATVLVLAVLIGIFFALRPR
jgi:serine/threonine protein kinase